MAIVKSLWLRNAKRRLGGAVAYTLKGQQVLRELAASVSNPQTSAQMSRRVKLANLVAIYRANRDWMQRYAFEVKKQTWSVYNAFVSANLNSNEVALTKAEAEAGAAVVAPYKMTDGSLPMVEISSYNTQGVYGTNLNLGSLSIIGDDTTTAAVSQALISNNNGLAYGMQLSLIENFQTIVAGVPRVIVRAYEVILSATDTTPFKQRINSANIIAIEDNTGAYTLGYNSTNSNDVVGFAFVLSQTISGKTYVSPSYLTLNGTTTYEKYKSAVQIDAAVASYGSANKAPFLDSTKQGTDTDGGVNISPTIIAARIGNAGVYSAVGDYLGIIGSENPFTIDVQLSSAPNEVLSGSASNREGTATAASVSSNGSVVTLSFNGGTLNPSLAISKIGIVLDGGIVVEADFETSGVTE